MRVAYLGPAGTFTEAAARRGVPDAELVPLPTIFEAAAAVDSGDADLAVVPIENSIEGSVNATLDILAFETDTVKIVGESVLAVEQCLIARAPIELSEIEVVISHPQATAQCARFIRENIPQARVMTSASTADAVKLVSERIRHRWSAIGTRLAAELYGATVLSTGIEDLAGNETRFIWLASHDQTPLVAALGDEPQPTRYKTAIVFWGSGTDAAGWLTDCLSELSTRNVNMTRIESRPRRQALGQYLFFVDIEGHVDDAPVAAALTGLRRHTEMLRVLGTFPAAAATEPAHPPLPPVSTASPSGD